jgi:hypothetical protein
MRKSGADPDNFDRVGRGLGGGRPLTLTTVNQTLCNCWHAPAKLGCHDGFFLPPLADSEKQKNYRVSHFTPSPRRTPEVNAFPITAEKSHILIFNSPPLGVSAGQQRSKARQ